MKRRQEEKEDGKSICPKVAQGIRLAKHKRWQKSHLETKD